MGGNEQKCLDLFNEMKVEDVKPSLVTYTTLMQMFIKKKKIPQAIDIFNHMKSSGIKPDQVCYNFMVNGCTFTQKLEHGIAFLLESIKADVKLSPETYNNVLEYLLNNKFMKYKERVDNAQNILKLLKERNINIKYDLYSRLLRLIYNNNNSNKEVEGNLKENFTNFTNLSETSSVNSEEINKKPTKQSWRNQNGNSNNKGIQEIQQFR